MINVERDINLAKSGKDLIYKTLIGLKADLSKPAEKPEILANKHKADSKSTKEGSDICTSSEESDDSDSENENETDSEDNKIKFVSSARPRNESPESRKVSTLFIFLRNYTFISSVIIHSLLRNYIFISSVINLQISYFFRRARRQSKNSRRRSGKSR